jgi:hypothetical protein
MVDNASWSSTPKGQTGTPAQGGVGIFVRGRIVSDQPVCRVNGDTDETHSYWNLSMPVLRTPASSPAHPKGARRYHTCAIRHRVTQLPALEMTVPSHETQHHTLILHDHPITLILHDHTFLLIQSTIDELPLSLVRHTSPRAGVRIGPCRSGTL